MKSIFGSLLLFIVLPRANLNLKMHKAEDRAKIEVRRGIRVLPDLSGRVIGEC
jgi:hypothetical protein